MKKLVLPFELVPDTVFQKLKRAIPSEYRAKKTDDPNKFTLVTYWNEKEIVVATVTVVDQKFVYEFADDVFSAVWFEDQMKRCYLAREE